MNVYSIMAGMAHHDPVILNFNRLRVKKSLRSKEFVLKHRIIIGIGFGVLLFAVSGCRIREYMVPLIINGELDKIAEQQPHQSQSLARVTRNDATQEVEFTVDFSPPDRLRYNFDSLENADGMILCVSTELFEIYDPKTNRGQRIVGLPLFDKSTFKEFRKRAILRALRANRAYIENAEGELGNTHWQLHTIPRKEGEGYYETFSYIDKETKHNVRAIEVDPSGRIVNEFLTLSKEEPFEFPENHFKIYYPENCKITEFDFNSFLPLEKEMTEIPAIIPREHEKQDLVRYYQSTEGWGYDYSERQKIFLYLEFPSDSQPLLKSPISRETSLNDTPVFLNYAGIYITCRWREEEKDHWIFTTLGPEAAIDYAKHILESKPSSIEQPVVSDKNESD